MTTYLFLWCLLSTAPGGNVCKESDPFPTLQACEAFRQDMARDLAWMVRTQRCENREGT